MSGSTITGKVTHTVRLGPGHYQSPLTITGTGDIAPAGYGANGIDGSAALQNAAIDNAGVVMGGLGSGDSIAGGIGIDMLASVALTNTGTIGGGGEGSNGFYGAFRGGNGVDLTQGGTIANTGLISGGTAGGSGDTSMGARGGIGVDLFAGGTITNGGTIEGGGGGYNYHVAGNGGAGVRLGGGGALVNTGTVIGGKDGQGGLFGGAGTGGSGVIVLGGTVDNSSTGTITGGYGQYGGGPGGAGVFMAGGTMTNDGTITGGEGGFGYGKSATGGAGVDLSGGAVVTNTGAITGGAGYYGHEYGGNGGAGVLVHGGATLVASGTITGGVGGRTGEQAPGHGGVGVVIEGGTLIASGTITGGLPGFGAAYAQADAVRFDSGGGTLVIDPGAVFSGKVVAQSGAGDALVLSGPGPGTLSGLGTAFQNFASLAVDAGADWKLIGDNTLAAGSVLTDSGALPVSHSLIDAGQVNLEAGGVLSAVGTGEVLVRELVLAGGVLRDDPGATLAVGATLAGAAAGAITVEAGTVLSGFGTLVGASVIDGFIGGVGGTLVLSGNVSGNGEVLLEPGGPIVVQGALGGVGVTFDANATLVLGAPDSVTSTMSLFESGDVIDLQHLKGDSLSYNAGTLTLMQGGSIVDRVFLAGSYDTNNFALSTDGHGGTDISFVSDRVALDSGRVAPDWIWRETMTPDLGNGGWHSEAGSPGALLSWALSHFGH